ncbi:ABC transporter substrate-binding protein [Clostridium butyricum]
MNLKKLSSILLAGMLSVSLLAGCGSKADVPTTSSNADGKIQLKLGIWPEDTLTDEVELHKGYKAKMEEKYSNVEVVPSYYKYSTETFVPMAESGNLPTIFETWYTEPQKLIKGGYVADITDILKKRGWDEAINPQIKKLLSDENGRIYGIPRDGYALGVMANVELFEQAGLVDDEGHPVIPKTWEDLAKTAQTIKEKTGQAGLCLLAKDNGGGWHFSNIAWAFGATLTKQGEDGKFTANVDSKEAIDAMQYVKDLKWKYDCLTADPTNEDWGTGFANLGTGTAAMYIGANDAVNQPTENNGLSADKLAMFAMPAGPNGQQYSLSGGTPYMFSKNATEDEINAALDYLEIMGKAPVATEDSIAGMEADAKNKVASGVPVIKNFPCWVNQDVLDAQEKVVNDNTNVDEELFSNYFETIGKEGNLRMEEPGSAQDLYAELTKVMQAVLTNKDADVADLMKDANTNYQRILDDKCNK